MSVNRYGGRRGYRSPSGARRWRLPVTIGVAAMALAGGGLGVALAGTGGPATASTIVCPDVAGELPAVPARARPEVDRNLALLDKQLDEANARLARSAGEGGPDFVRNAILGPLQSKRSAAIDRIAISIGRVAEKPTGLGGLAACSLAQNGAGAKEAPPAAEAPPVEDVVVGGISCPAVRNQLPAVPAQARAEVDRNLALLDKQLDEANARLARSAGEGGPNFVRNAILGPLEDKRFATLNRIATAIGRNAAKPVGLDALAPCSLAG